MNTFSLKLPKDKINKIKETFKDDIKPSKNEYIDTFISREGLTISIYTNDKVVFQGSDALFMLKTLLKRKYVDKQVLMKWELETSLDQFVFVLVL